MNLLPRKQGGVGIRNPFQEMEQAHRDLARLFNLSVPGFGDENASLLEGFWSPAVDVIDRKDEILVKADLPGLAREDIEVNIENNVLTIRGEKKQEGERKEGSFVRSERYYGSFQRAFTLPSTVDPQKVTATFKDGVLSLVVGKKEEARPRQIRIDVK